MILQLYTECPKKRPLWISRTDWTKFSKTGFEFDNFVYYVLKILKGRFLGYPVEHKDIRLIIIRYCFKKFTKIKI